MPAAKRKPVHEEHAPDAVTRNFWSGTLSFGLVSVPVSLIPAVRSTRPRLRMLDGDGNPLRRRYYCPKDNKEVDPEQVVRGYRVDEKMIPITDEELEDLAPERSRDIDLLRFVDEDELDAMLFERPYYLVPDGSTNKAYRLLARVLEAEEKVGIATFVMRGKQCLVAVRADRGLLRAETLRMPDEVRSPEEIGLAKRPPVPAAAVKKIEKAIAAHAGARLSLAELADVDTEKLERLIEQRRKAGKVAHGEPTEDDDGTVVDLMAVLKERLAKGKRGRRGARS